MEIYVSREATLLTSHTYDVLRGETQGRLAPENNLRIMIERGT
jgi:hypothetical protein